LNWLFISKQAALARIRVTDNTNGHRGLKSVKLFMNKLSVSEALCGAVVLFFISTTNVPAASVPAIPGRLNPTTAGTMTGGKSNAGFQFGVGPHQRSVGLAPLTADAIEAIQQFAGGTNSSGEKGRLQIGFGRPLPDPIVVNRDTVSKTEWQVLSNGWRAWSAQISSPGALGLRVHLEALALPANSRIFVYASTNPGNPAVISPEKLGNNTEAWASTIFSDSVVVEAQVPPGTDVSLPVFTVTGVSHIYRLPVPKILKVGGCELDVTCYPAWAGEAAGVALIDFLDGGQEFVCTGCLLSNGFTNSPANFFLTAHHCITSPAAASTMEAFWFYQTSTCNGVPPDIATVPMTGPGATLLATSTRSDFSFLLLDNNPPNGVEFLGWTTALPTDTETISVIHHPMGDYKRISFGNVTGANPGFWFVQWFAGVTEEGSSGSPLLNANHQVIGQLFGGTSSCANPTGMDQFGRFDVTYKTIQRWLNPIKGTYTGLFAQTTGPAPQSAGAFTLTATPKSTFTGSVQIGNARYPMRGQFDNNGFAQVPIKGRNLPSPTTVSLQLDFSAAPGFVEGTISNSTWVAQLLGHRLVFDGKTMVSPQLGKYTMIIPGNGDGSTAPGGDSFATVSVDKFGRIRMVGSLADGTRVMQSSTTSSDAVWPLYVPLYGGQGLLWSFILFTNSVQGDLGGDLTWVKTNVAKAKFYPNGFIVETNAWGSSYQNPGPGQNPLNLASANLVLTGGGLSQPVSNSLAFTGNRGTSSSGGKASLTFNPGVGTFSGRVAGQPKPIVYNGVALQVSNYASGFFLGTSQSGRVTVSP
jgi:hypothetical protein